MKKHITSEHADLKWERLRLKYLRKCRRTLYTELLATDNYYIVGHKGINIDGLETRTRK